MSIYLYRDINREVLLKSIDLYQFLFYIFKFVNILAGISVIYKSHFLYIILNKLTLREIHL